MEKSELIEKILEIVMSDIDSTDKIIDIYVLIDTERKKDKIKKESTKKMEDDFIRRMMEEIEKRNNRDKFKGGDEHCYLESFHKRNPNFKGSLFLSCNCSKCKRY